MPPVSSLAGILDSPVASSNGSTVLGNGNSTTLPDVSLASLGSSFHSAQEGGFEEYESRRECACLVLELRRQQHQCFGPQLYVWEIH